MENSVESIHVDIVPLRLKEVILINVFFLAAYVLSSWPF